MKQNYTDRLNHKISFPIYEWHLEELIQTQVHSAVFVISTSINTGNEISKPIMVRSIIDTCSFVVHEALMVFAYELLSFYLDTIFLSHWFYFMRRRRHVTLLTT